MTDEHMGTCIYEKGRFELRETDNAIIDLRGDFPPIMIASNTVDDGSEPNCADTRSVFHLLNELADNNPNEERHWYLKKMLDKSWKQYHEQKDENEQLKSELSRYKEVNRLDIWKSSYSSEDALITELQMKCDKKQEHIVVLENKIRRMREAIHKLEWLATHRNGDLERENKQLKSDNNALQERNDRQAETIQKLYQLITNKDWKALTTYMEELDKCEEQLQSEWGLYSD